MRLHQWMAGWLDIGINSTQTMKSPGRVVIFALLFHCSAANAIDTAQLESGQVLTTDPAPADTAFATWLIQLKQDALAKGISPHTLVVALPDGLQRIARVIELDQRQPEFVDTFWNYLDRRVDEQRIRKGRDKLREHRKLLAKVQTRYGIPPQILVALWGLETGYGASTGSFPTPAALATLASGNRRSAFFRSELLHALSILEQGHLPVADMTGSWAGAMGQMQFMPATFLNHAIDADGDGRKDIWKSLPDVFHSAANYLRKSGWRPGELWGREIRLPEDFDFDVASPDIKKSVKTWNRLGIRQISGKPLPAGHLEGSIVLPQGHEGPAFLIYHNFHVIMEWNRSINYALAVGHLSDRLLSGPALKLGRDADNRRLTRDQYMEIQQLLQQLGYSSGDIDGVPGSRTRQAIRAYQKAVGLPVDGHASARLLEYMQRAAPAGVQS